MSKENVDHLKELFKEQIEMLREGGCKDSEEKLFEFAYEQLNDVLEDYRYYEYKNGYGN
jgi:hypothetical protein